MFDIDVSHQPGSNLNVENKGAATSDVMRASRKGIFGLRCKHGEFRDFFA